MIELAAAEVMADTSAVYISSSNGAVASFAAQRRAIVVRVGAVKMDA